MNQMNQQKIHDNNDAKVIKIYKMDKSYLCRHMAQYYSKPKSQTGKRENCWSVEHPSMLINYSEYYYMV